MDITTKTYGWYSDKQLSVNKRLFYYKDINENTVQVTMISSTKNHGTKFDDMMYRGIMKSYIKKIAYIKKI